MSLIKKDYDLLISLFEDEGVVSLISLRDKGEFCKLLWGKLNGTKEGVLELEKITNIILSIIKENKVDKETISFLYNSIIELYSFLGIKILKL